MSSRRLLVLGAIAYALALMVTAPATLVDASLRRASDGRLRLTEAAGSLWSGSGQLEIREPDGRAGVARGIAWRVTPASLARGRLVCEVGLEQAAQRFPVTLSFSGIELSNADVSLPAAVLGIALPKLVPLGLTGEVAIHVAQLSIAGGGVEGKVTLRWRGAGSALTPLSPLGEYEVRVDSAGMKTHASLATLAGPLELDGKGSWKQGDSIAFRATARVPAPHLQQLAPVLRLVAVETAKGVFELQLK